MGANMKTKGKKKQNKIVLRITAPWRILNKARDFYKKRLTFDCAGRIDKNSIISCTAPHFSAIHSSKDKTIVKRCQEADDDDDDDIGQKIESRNCSSMKGESGNVVRSYSIGVGRIGRIDEDEPCDFKEVDVNKFVYPRCRSYAFAKRKPVY